MLLALSLHMSEVGETFFPTLRELAEETLLSQRCVGEHLQKAESEGWLKKTADHSHDYRGHCLYEATIPDGWQP